MLFVRARKARAVAFLAVFALCFAWSVPAARAAVPGGSLDPAQVPKYQAPLIIPPAMPMTGTVTGPDGKSADYYEIAVRQFQQQILPPGLPVTTVWSYGSVQHPGTVFEGGSFHYPAFTVEARWERPVQVKWINDLVDGSGNYIPHLLAVDQTLHWANPPGPRDSMGMDPEPYTGPVPIVTHVHGAHTYQESDGYPEAWYLPVANNIPADIAYTTGTYYDIFKASSAVGSLWTPGSAVFYYPNDQRATTLWYHDHTLGMTRLNVYAGPAGFYLLRGGPDDLVMRKNGKVAALPGPAPQLGDAAGVAYREIPLAIQDRSFNSDGSLFYPDSRAFFEGLEPDQLQIPFIPEDAAGGPSDISPIWNPEFFGNMMVVNGRTWPYLEVEPARYRLRLLNGCNSRFLILKFDAKVSFWQIGAEGGFLKKPIRLNQILMSPAERADVIVDFSDARPGATITLLNIAPDEPFGGGVPGVDFEPSDPASTGQVMQFKVVTPKGKGKAKGLVADDSTPPNQLVLPPIGSLGSPSVTRQLSLNETDSGTVFVTTLEDGTIVFDPESDVPFGPESALLGTLLGGEGNPLGWMEAVTEDPALGATEVWEIHNFTMDAHPIHIHVVQFQVVDRQPFGGAPRAPEPWESGFKDTVIAFPGEITRVRARFDIAGLFVWHCHIVEHEDNEMMRPYRIGSAP